MTGVLITNGAFFERSTPRFLEVLLSGGDVVLPRSPNEAAPNHGTVPNHEDFPFHVHRPLPVEGNV